MTKTSEILPIKKKVGRPAKNLNGKTVRQIVLDEARKLVSQHGTDSLSFDRLSKETGIAKGTILYQFKRKEDLLLALLQAHASELEAKFKTAEKKIDTKSSEIDPICATFIEWGKEFVNRQPKESTFGLAIQAAFSETKFPENPINGWFREIFQKVLLSKDSNPEKAIICLLAIQGLFFMDFLQMDALSKEQTLTVLDNLRKFLTDDNKAN